jgi:CMP-N-acetylneuraminic acid synthetase
MNRMVLIPARAGSTRVVNKNLRELAGRPLLGHVITAARSIPDVRVVVSTNSAEIAAVARQFGAEVPFMRPDALSTATASSLSTILHALATLHAAGEAPDLLAFCPPTNPLVRGATIGAMFEQLAGAPDFNSIVTIAAPRTHPFRIVRRDAEGRVINGAIAIDGKTINDIERSQDWPKVWEGSPACRMTRARFFLEMLDRGGDIATIAGKTYDVARCLGHEIDGIESFDINEEADLVLAEYFLKRRSP